MSLISVNIHCAGWFIAGLALHLCPSAGNTAGTGNFRLENTEKSAPLLGDWIEQRARTDRFRFRLKVEKEGEGRFAVRGIEVIDVKSRTRRQLIHEIDGSPVWSSPESLLAIVDGNFDGYPDISVPAADGGAGPNSTNFFFIYRPRQNTFSLDVELSSLPQVSIKPNGVITSSSRNGCCSHSIGTYRYMGGKLTLVESWDESLTPDGMWIETTIGALLHGKLVYTTTRKAAPGE